MPCGQLPKWLSCKDDSAPSSSDATGVFLCQTPAAKVLSAIAGQCISILSCLDCPHDPRQEPASLNAHPCRPARRRRCHSAAGGCLVDQMFLLLAQPPPLLIDTSELIDTPKHAGRAVMPVTRVHARVFRADLQKFSSLQNATIAAGTSLSMASWPAMHTVLLPNCR